MKIRAAERLRARNRYLRWGHDPVAFVHDVFDWEGQGPTSYQEETLDALARTGAVAERGPHGLGKTTLAALSVLWFRCTRDDLEEFPSWMVLTTAGVWRQLEKFLWPEIHKWIRRIRWDVLKLDPFVKGVDLLDVALKGRTGQAIAVASDNSDLIEGAHADSLLYVYDEAASIPPKTWDAAEGAFAGAGGDTRMEALRLAVGKPTTPAGIFYDIHTRKPGYERWWTRHVKVEEAIEAGRVSAEWVAEKERQWGKDSSVFRRRVLGEFAGDDERGVIPLSWIEAAEERWHIRNEPMRDAGPLGWVPLLLDRLGVDVAEGGTDQTIIAPMTGDYVGRLIRPGVGLTTATAGQVLALAEPTRATAVVDVLGVGAGVGADLIEKGIPVVRYKGSEGTDKKDRTGMFGFANVRSAAYWSLREELDPTYEPTLALPPDDELTGDLTTPRYDYTSQATIVLEPKKKVIERLGRSPDAADAVVMGRWQGSVGTSWSSMDLVRGRTI